jgi:hypothetical protein
MAFGGINEEAGRLSGRYQQNPLRVGQQQEKLHE